MSSLNAKLVSSFKSSLQNLVNIGVNRENPSDKSLISSRLKDITIT
jgi:hypothetical protein